jgi:hypothetical protein
MFDGKLAVSVVDLLFGLSIGGGQKAIDIDGALNLVILAVNGIAIPFEQGNLRASSSEEGWVKFQASA